MISNNKIHVCEQVSSAGNIILSRKEKKNGFSLIELIISMLITLVILGIAVTTFSNALGSRERESSSTDAITSTQAALNIMSREIRNSGYGLKTNGIVFVDSDDKSLRIRANIVNDDSETNDAGEDLTFYLDEDTKSVVRYDAYNGGTTSGIINKDNSSRCSGTTCERVSDVDFVYYDYTFNYVTNTVVVTESFTPSANTGRINITLKVTLADVRGQPANRSVKVSSDITLRNSPFMLGQY